MTNSFVGMVWTLNGFDLAFVSTSFFTLMIITRDVQLLRHWIPGTFTVDINQLPLLLNFIENELYNVTIYSMSSILVTA